MSTSPMIRREGNWPTIRTGITKYVSGALLVAFSLAHSNGSMLQPYGRAREPAPMRLWMSSVTEGEGKVSPPNTTPVANWLQELESQLGLTRSGLAALLGVSRQTLYHWSNGSDLREQNATRLQALRGAAQLLQVSMSGSSLPALWQYQVLPSLGVSFAQGMREGRDPVAIAKQLTVLWRSDAAESADMDALFARGV